MDDARTWRVLQLLRPAYVSRLDRAAEDRFEDHAARGTAKALEV